MIGRTARVPLTAQSRLLLQAALCSPQQARDAWRNLQARTAIADLNGELHCLLPLVHRNLPDVEEGSEQARLAGVQRHTWVANARVIAAAAEIIDCCISSGIQALVLGDMAQALAYYPGAGLRRIPAIHLLIRPDDRPAARSVVTACTWTWPGEERGSTLRFGSASCTRSHFPAPLRVSWHPYGAGVSDASLWSTAGTITVGPVSASVIGATDALFDACVAVRFGYSTSWVQSLADAAMVLHQNPADLDTTRLIARAVETQTVLTVHHTLQTLKELNLAHVPQFVLDTLGALRVTPLDRFEHIVAVSPQCILPRIGAFWFRFRADVDESGQSAAMSAFPRYIVEGWRRNDHRATALEALRASAHRAWTRVGVPRHTVR